MEKRYAGFWIRVLANLLDGLVLLLPTALIEFLSYRIGGPEDMGYWEYQTSLEAPLWSAYDGLSIGLSVLVGILYFGLLTSKYYGTPGKLIVGVRVLGEDGNRISLARSIGRYFAYIPSSIFMIGYIMVGLTSKKQGLHDKMCKTYVVYK